MNNQLKHDTKLTVIYYEVCGSSYPFRFPRRYGSPGIYWNDFEDHSESKKAKRAHYDANLNKKDVRKTLECMEQIVLKFAI